MNFSFLLLLFILGSHNMSSNQVQGLRAEKINGGMESKRGRFKYTVAVRYKLDGTNHSWNPCSGSILDKWHISTIAGCFFKKPFEGLRERYFYITIGANNLKAPNLWTRHIRVDKVYIPKTFQPNNPSNYEGNFAIVKLAESLDLEENKMYRAVEIYKGGIKNEQSLFRVSGYGWMEVQVVLGEVNGKIEFMRTGYSDGKLRSIQAFVLSNAECEKIIQSSIAPGNMCVKAIRTDPDEPVGICQDDGGAPFVTSYNLYGIAIDGFISCDEERMPGIYINASYYRQFIEDALADRKTHDMYVLQLHERRHGRFAFIEV